MRLSPPACEAKIVRLSPPACEAKIVPLCLPAWGENRVARSRARLDERHTTCTDRPVGGPKDYEEKERRSVPDLQKLSIVEVTSL